MSSLATIMKYGMAPVNLSAGRGVRGYSEGRARRAGEEFLGFAASRPKKKPAAASAEPRTPASKKRRPQRPITRCVQCGSMVRVDRMKRHTARIHGQTDVVAGPEGRPASAPDS
jgi:hypothetical protein